MIRVTQGIKRITQCLFCIRPSSNTFEIKEGCYSVSFLSKYLSEKKFYPVNTFNNEIFIYKIDMLNERGKEAIQKIYEIDCKTAGVHIDFLVKSILLESKGFNIYKNSFSSVNYINSYFKSLKNKNIFLNWLDENQIFEIENYLRILLDTCVDIQKDNFDTNVLLTGSFCINNHPVVIVETQESNSTKNTNETNSTDKSNNTKVTKRTDLTNKFFQLNVNQNENIKRLLVNINQNRKIEITGEIDILSSSGTIIDIKLTKETERLKHILQLYLYYLLCLYNKRYINRVIILNPLKSEILVIYTP